MGDQRVIVREAHADDAVKIDVLQVRAWKHADRGIFPDDFLDELNEEAWTDRWVRWLSTDDRDGTHLLVSCSTPGGPPVAVAACGPAKEPDREATGQLYVLYADPSVRGHGHGSELLRLVHELLAADGHLKAILWVAARNQRAIDFYEHHGWARDGATQREAVHGVVVEELRMVKATRTPA